MNKARTEPRFYYEDFEVGSVATFGPRTITREEIGAYAAEFDPQPMHLDDEAAKATLLGGLAASGWHTCCFMMRFSYDSFIAETASLGSPGVEEVKWLKPVRPGMSLTLRRTVLGKRISKSRPEMGIARIRLELLDGSGVPVIEETYTHLLARRAPEAAR